MKTTSETTAHKIVSVRLPHGLHDQVQKLIATPGVDYQLSPFIVALLKAAVEYVEAADAPADAPDLLQITRFARQLSLRKK